MAKSKRESAASVSLATATTRCALVLATQGEPGLFFLEADSLMLLSPEVAMKERRDRFLRVSSANWCFLVAKGAAISSTGSSASKTLTSKTSGSLSVHSSGGATAEGNSAPGWGL